MPEIFLINPFPFLFNYSYAAPLLLRLAMSAAFFSFGIANTIRVSQLSISATESIGLKPGKFFLWILGLFEIIIASAFFAGLQPQIAGIAAGIVLVSAIILKKKEPDSLRHSLFFYAILIVIGLSLILSGPGYFALTYPL